MIYEIVKTNIVSIISLLFSVCIPIFLYYKLYKPQADESKSNITPFPVLESAIFRKENAESPFLVREIFGTYENDILSNNTIRTNELPRSTPEDINFIKECQERQGSVYFTRRRGLVCLMVNIIKNKNKFILDFCDTDLELKNYGSMIHGLEIVSVNIDGKQIMPSKPYNYLPCTIRSGKSLHIMNCVLTTDIDDSPSRISPSDYANMPNHFDLLKDWIISNLLQYNRVEFIINCWNIKHIKFTFKIVFEKQGNYFISHTESI